MASLNKAILIGYITKDPELKKTQSDLSVTSFTIGVSRRGKNDQTDFINVVAWRGAAETVCRFFHKGDPIQIVGSIQVRSYDDKDGKKHYLTEVVADEVGFISSKKDKEERTYTPTEGSAPAYAPNVELSEISDEDLPF